MHMSAKKIVLCCLAIVIAIMTIVGPAFYLFRINPNNPVTVPDDMDVPSYIYENAGKGEMGFDFFDFDSDFLVGSPDIEELGVISIIQLCLGILGLLLALAALIFCKTNVAQTLCYATVIMGLLISATYALVGVLFTIRLLNITFVGLYLNFYTLSYVPFAIIAVFALAYVLVAHIMPNPATEDKSSKTAKPTRTAYTPTISTNGIQKVETASHAVPAAPTMSHEEITSLLFTYKQLLDDGIITQDEFERKKRSILSK